LLELEFPFEFSIENPDNSGKTDLETIVEHVFKKKPCLKNGLMKPLSIFKLNQKEDLGSGFQCTEISPMGENSPLKQQSNLKCFFLTNPNNGYQNTTSESMENLKKGNQAKSCYCKNCQTSIIISEM